jgi:elongation factor 1 alpha-like protein
MYTQELESKMHTGTPKPKAKKTHGDKLAEPMEKLAVSEVTKVKSKNLNVVDEYNKSGMKRIANFVVIGMHDPTHPVITMY